MATVSHTFLPTDGVPPSSAYARYDVLGTTPVPCLKFTTGAVSESIYFYFRAVSYGSGNITVKIDWYADTGSAEDVVWDAAIMCVTPNDDDVDIETASFDTAATVTDTHLGGSAAQRLHQCTATITATDSITAGDYCVLKLTRDTGDGADDMAGDANVVMVTVEYST